jgi:hypothetical protein
MNGMDDIEKTIDSFKKFLKEKNKRYGNSVLEPLNIFSKHIKKENSQALNNMLTRLDDKLKRIQNSNLLRKNDIIDIMGYLVFLCISKGWKDFDDLID